MSKYWIAIDSDQNPKALVVKKDEGFDVLDLVCIEGIQDDEDDPHEEEVHKPRKYKKRKKVEEDEGSNERKERVIVTDKMKERIQELKAKGRTSGEVAEELGISNSTAIRYWI